ncbi:FAD-binding dehydrogenase [Microlunatus endophyticus]|uniref:FAD-binding dehydrogenase n=1 Tax=Microlunatus endophyticus TaxID=1716077 RepID=A0A917W787_9ACTN|nr:FAD-binding dehydrogenase [Microlunatus endophyticus]GGL77917.1 FAD-binding dehydrogenase [Microlunatus endophyticus]
MDADVIVIGAGLSGLVATAELAAAGRSVILLDGEPAQSLGGQAYWSFGGLFMVDTPEQRRMRVKDSAALALADWMGSAGFDSPSDYWPRRWAEAYVSFASGELRSWLYGLGVRWFPVVQWAERGGGPIPGHGNSVPRFHITWGTGPALVQPFLDRIRGNDRVRILNRHKVSGLETGPDGVRVNGQVLLASTVPRGARSPDGVARDFSFSASAVIISSGGIGGNVDLVRKYWPADWGRPPEKMIIGVPDFVDGSMLQVAEQAGGRVINRTRMWHYPEGVINHAPIWTEHGIRILPGPSALWVDAHGERLPFPLYPGFDALGALRHITSRGDDHSWFVLDLETVGKELALSGSEQNADLTGKDIRQLSTRVRPGPTPEVQAFLRRGADFVTAGSVDDLVARMNKLTGTDHIDADRLRQLIELRDQQVVSGLGKDPQVTATAAARRYLGDRLSRVATPHPYLDPRRPGAGIAGTGGPLVAVRLHVLTRKTLGGLETDLDGRVLTADGSPLPGVYAAGEVSGFGGGGVHGYRSLEGTFLGGCLFSGRVAGQAAAAAVG